MRLRDAAATTDHDRPARGTASPRAEPRVTPLVLGLALALAVAAYLAELRESSSLRAELRAAQLARERQPALHAGAAQLARERQPASQPPSQPAEPRSAPFDEEPRSPLERAETREASLAAERESSSRAERLAAAAAVVREVAGKRLTLAAEPGLRLLHPWGLPAQRLEISLGGGENVVAGPAESHVASSFGKLGLVDSTGLRGTLQPGEDPAISDAALILQRLARQLASQDGNVGAFRLSHGSDATTAGAGGNGRKLPRDGSIGTIALPGGMLTLVAYPLGPSGTMHEVVYSAHVQTPANVSPDVLDHPSTRPTAQP